jgi:hypothetical protein
MSETAPWWADVQHLRPAEGGGPARAAAAEQPARAPERRSHRFDRVQTAELSLAVKYEPRRSKPDFDFDIGLSSLLDPPAEENGEWLELTVDEALSRLTGESNQAQASLTADDKASGWDMDIWSETDADRKQRRTAAAPAPSAPARPRRPQPTAAERITSRPDRVALWAFLLGVLLILIAAIGTPKANAAEIDAAAAHQAPAIVVAVDATP